MPSKPARTASGVLKTNLVIVVSSLILAAAAIAFNYHLAYHERLEHSKAMLHHAAQHDIGPLVGKLVTTTHGVDNGAFADILRQHLHLPGIELFAALLDGRGTVIAEVALPDGARPAVTDRFLQTRSDFVERDGYVLLSLAQEGSPNRLVMGMTTASVEASIQPQLVGTAFFVGVGLLLYAVVVIATIRYLVVEPLAHFLENGIRSNVEGILSGHPVAAGADQGLGFAPRRIAEQVRRSLRMLSAWGRHKANLDRFITVSINESEKGQLARNLHQTLRNEFRVQGVTLLELNHSTNRLEPLYGAPAGGGVDELLANPQLCFVVRSGAALVQDAGEEYCRQCRPDSVEPMICKPLVAGGKQTGVCRVVFDTDAMDQDLPSDQGRRLDVINAFLQPYVDMASLSLSNLSLLESYKNQAITDGLTGLYNRRYVVEYLTNVLNLAKRRETPLSVLVVDIDNFKRLNDEYGHITGDKVLRAISATMRRAVRDTDTVARYGGEEFVIVLPDADAEAALDSAERVRAAVAGIDWEKEALPNIPMVTISIGAAQFPLHGYSHYHLINAGDRALYAAKRSGKNRVMLHQELPEES